MRNLTLLAGAIVLAGCTKAEDRSVGAATTGDTAAPAATTAATTPISLRELAGNWKVRTTDEQGGTPIETHIRATADSSDWTMVGPDNKPVPVRVVAVGGDSIVTEAGPFPSFIVKGAKVSTRTVYRLQGDRLVGTTEARYKIGGRDSVALRAAEATRMR